MKNIPFDSWTKTIKYGFITIRDHWPIQVPSPATSPHQSPLYINLILRVKKWKIDNNVVFFFFSFFFIIIFFHIDRWVFMYFYYFFHLALFFPIARLRGIRIAIFLYTYRSYSMYNTIIWKKVWGLSPFSIFFFRITFEKWKMFVTDFHYFYGLPIETLALLMCQLIS